ncbi:MAG TPA: hypothetical protein DF383_06940 [Deltaproteobacteria bacterium]|nr:hypothetical protein [Deltaproteobacteria bacterium]
MQLGPRVLRLFLNIYPPYLFSRTQVKYISPDWRQCVVELKKSFLTRNYVGTTFGGSLFAAADPIFMLMLIHILGIKNYVIWDKEAKIKYLKPARSTITFHFEITAKDLKNIQSQISRKGKALPQFKVFGIDAAGKTCVEVDKQIYIRKKIKS